MVAAEAMLGVEQELPTLPSPRGDTPSPTVSICPVLSLQTLFSKLPLAVPAGIPSPMKFLAAGWDVEGFFSKYGWQEALSN